MCRFSATVLVLLIFSPFAFSQHAQKECHVYVLDVAAAKSWEDDEKLLNLCEKNSAKCGLVEFPVFQPAMGEEDLTTKTYRFPWAPLTITANVLVTDDTGFGDSAILTISLSKSSPKNVQADENSAQAEIGLGEKDSAGRVKRYYRVYNKQFLIGLECRFGDP